MTYSFKAPNKDPDATLDYELNWSTWLADGETITAQTVTCDNDDITISAVTQAAGVVRFRVAGGTAGSSYLVTCEVTTSAGQTDQRTMLIPVRER
ncbi:hypothetical protein C7451_106162 [Blastomonas natatoria]|uniref:Uncharacterized protein n=1 Tax=Blastomonas natatoria TaxID=34015 RepID=A0A2V3V5J0_9SPHN|nr:hypothetical protein [Blastomonas natatoria]PXW75998.1 hypothetical protein C7451_106162 [Blastomonas natatoria]